MDAPVGQGEEPIASKLVSIVECDPDLAALIPPDERSDARRRAAARVEVVEPGPWGFRSLPDPGAFGLLVLNGLVGARVSLGEQAHLEVLGEGDLLRPWVHIGPEASVPSEVGWQVFDDTRVALLDEDFARGVAPWPQVAAGLMHRLVLRARRLSFQLALAGISRIDERILIALWHFADRWGRVTPEGVLLRLALTQTQLAEVVRAARPTVSTAINELRRGGAVAYDRGEQTWTLYGNPPPTVRELKEQVGL